MTPAIAVAAAPKKRGRPMVKSPLKAKCVWLPDEVLDAYCRESLASRTPLSTLLRRILVKHAPRRPF